MKTAPPMPKPHLGKSVRAREPTACPYFRFNYAMIEQAFHSQEKTLTPETELRKSIPLADAVSEIKQACDASNASGTNEGRVRSPFFFFVGSGISYPSIPLAPEIQHHCEEIAKSLGRNAELRGTDPNDAYSQWFKAAYPHRVQRQEYLRGLIKNAPITHANFRLAHLLLRANISNIVVTVNFDDLLSRALTLFGEQPIICDDPRTVERIDPEKPDIQLIHAHGSYWFYDCRNTSEEILDRARPLEDTTLTMAALLDKTLANRAPLVIGYSGWESDVFMTALKRRLLTPLPFNLYWFCFHRSQASNLPNWLKFHPDVYFVVPPEGDAKEVSDDTAKLSDNNHSEPTLDATTVLDALIEQLGGEAPALTKDPLSFFAEQLRRSLPNNEAEKRNDIYSFRSVVLRVERAQQIEATQVKKIEAELESVRDALRRAQYDEATEYAEKIGLGDLTGDQLRDLLGALETAVKAMPDTSAKKLAACNLVVSYYDALVKIEGDQPGLQSFVAQTLNIKGNLSYAAKKYDEAISIYQDAVSRFENSDDPTVQDQLSFIWNNMGLALRNTQKFQEALNAHEAVLRIQEKVGKEDASNQMITALLFKGQALARMAKYEEAVQAFDAANVACTTGKELTPYTKAQIAASATEQNNARAQVALAQSQARLAATLAANKAAAEKAAAEKQAQTVAAAKQANDSAPAEQKENASDQQQASPTSPNPSPQAPPKQN